MKYLKSLTAVLLALAMMLSLFVWSPVEAADIIDSGSCGQYVTYTLDSDGLLTISGIGPMRDYESAPLYNTSLIKKAVIEDGVTTVGGSAFRDAEHLTSVLLPNSITKIGDFAFSRCLSLPLIEIPSSVTSIGAYAISTCYTLTSLDIPEGVVNIDRYAFYNDGITTVTIPGSVTSIEGNVFSQCSALKEISVAESNPLYHSDGNCLIDTKNKSLISGCKESVIPTDGSVTSIADYAFSYCSSLNSIVIPNSVSRIGGSAFIDCVNLTNVSIGSGVKDFGYGAFTGCSSLTSIDLPYGASSISGWMFGLCTSLRSITIPQSVTTIDDGAFYGCDRLNEVFYEGSESQWNSITIEENNNTLNYATIHFGAEDPPPTEPSTDPQEEPTTSVTEEPTTSTSAEPPTGNNDNDDSGSRLDFRRFAAALIRLLKSFASFIRLIFS